MPAIIPFIPLIAAGVSAGTAIYSAKAAAGAQADAAKQQAAQLAAQQKQQASLQSQQQALLARKAAPDAQAQTGGNLSDASFAQMVANMIGSPGSGSSVQSTLFGGGGSGTTSLTGPSGTSIPSADATGLQDTYSSLSGNTAGGDTSGGSSISLTDILKYFGGGGSGEMSLTAPAS